MLVPARNNFLECTPGQEVKLILEQIRGVLAQQKALLDRQEVINKELDLRLNHLEHCPCPVRHDPSKECPIYVIEKKFARYLGIFIGVSGVLNVAAIITSLLINLYRAR
jgi:hypothetical protein